MPIASPEALAEAAVHRSRSRPDATPRSWWMKIERNGNAKLNPKIAMSSANHSAARLRRQLTPPGLIGGVVARGSVLSSLRQQLDDAVGRDGKAIDHDIGLALPQRILDGVGDRGRHRDGAALARPLESFRVGFRLRLHVHDLRTRADLARAHDRVVQKARGPVAAFGVVDRRLVERV